jgi:hypothetical protein
MADESRVAAVQQLLEADTKPDGSTLNDGELAELIVETLDASVDAQHAPLGRLRLKHHQGVLSESVVMVGSKAVAVLPIHNFELKSPGGQALAEAFLSLHLDHVDLLTGPELPPPLPVPVAQPVEAQAGLLANGGSGTLAPMPPVHVPDPEDAMAASFAPGQRQGPPPAPICEGCGHQLGEHSADPATMHKCVVQQCACTGWTSRQLPDPKATIVR